MCRIETDGKGLYLGPASGKGFENVGNGLHLMKQGGLYDGSGLIFGPNSPFKNTPILGMILQDYFQNKNHIYYKSKLMKLMIKMGMYIVLKKLMKYRKY